MGLKYFWQPMVLQFVRTLQSKLYLQSKLRLPNSSVEVDYFSGNLLPSHYFEWAEKIENLNKVERNVQYQSCEA
jgi:hypothetical protein